MTPESNPNPEVNPDTAPSEPSQDRSEESPMVEESPTINVEAQSVTEAETVEAKAVEPKTVEPKTVEAKTVEAKTVEPKTVETKTPPKVTVPKTEGAASSPTAMDQVKAVGAELWKQAKPVLEKVGTQALLLGNRASDYLLDTAFPLAKEKFIQVLPDDFKTQTQAKIDPIKAKVVPIWQKAWPAIQKVVGPLWAKLIGLIRGKLPADLSGQLSDRFLNILVVTAFYLVWSFFSGLTHPSQAKQPTSDLTFPEVKNKPSLTAREKPKPRPTVTPSVTPKDMAEPAPKPLTPPKAVTPPSPPPVTPPVSKPPVSKPPVSKPPVSKPPESKPPVVSTPPVEPPKSVAPTVTPKPPVSPPTPTPIPPSSPSKSVEGVKPPEPSKPIEKAPTPPPVPVTPPAPVKPVQTGPDLVALKADLVDAADRVVEEASTLIKTVVVKDQQLKIQMGDRWYDLSEKDQSRLMDNLYSKSKKLSYERLDIRDAKDERIARTPYIGDNMIILKRSSSVDKPTSTSKEVNVTSSPKTD